MGLSGRREKQRIPDDPRNTKWATDTSMPGYKMLSSMGWTPTNPSLGVTTTTSSHPLPPRKIPLLPISKDDNLGIGASRTKSTALDTFGSDWEFRGSLDSGWGDRAGGGGDPRQRAKVALAKMFVSAGGVGSGSLMKEAAKGLGGGGVLSRLLERLNNMGAGAGASQAGSEEGEGEGVGEKGEDVDKPKRKKQKKDHTADDSGPRESKSEKKKKKRKDGSRTDGHSADTPIASTSALTSTESTAAPSPSAEPAPDTAAEGKKKKKSRKEKKGSEIDESTDKVSSKKEKKRKRKRGEEADEGGAGQVDDSESTTATIQPPKIVSTATTTIVKTVTPTPSPAVPIATPSVRFNPRMASRAKHQASKRLAYTSSAETMAEILGFVLPTAQVAGS